MEQCQGLGARLLAQSRNVPLYQSRNVPFERDKKVDQLLNMSAKELSRLEVMQKLSEKRMSQKEAGTILHLSTRQIKRLLKAYRKKGAASLISRQRGRRSNNRLAEDVKKCALNLLKTKYQGFGPKLAHEKLVDKEKLKLSDESVR